MYEYESDSYRAYEEADEGSSLGRDDAMRRAEELSELVAIKIDEIEDLQAEIDALGCDLEQIAESLDRLLGLGG